MLVVKVGELVEVREFFNLPTVFLCERAEKRTRGFVIFGNGGLDKTDTLRGICVELSLQQTAGHALPPGRFRYRNLPNKKDIGLGGDAIPRSEAYDFLVRLCDN